MGRRSIFKRILTALFGIVLIFSIILGVGVILTPTAEEQALDFVGSGKVLSSETKIHGFDMVYWARIKCSQDQVKEHLQITRKINTNRNLFDRFGPSFLNWPSNVQEYSTNWHESKRAGTHTIVAFNDRNDQEILYISWKH